MNYLLKYAKFCRSEQEMNPSKGQTLNYNGWMDFKGGQRTSIHTSAINYQQVGNKMQHNFI